MALAACSAETTAPGAGAGLPFGEGTTGGGSGTGTITSPVVGEWERFQAIVVDGDIVTTTIHWVFDADGSCARSITTFSANEGIPRTQLRSCTWRPGTAEITIRLGTDPENTFPLEFPGFDPDRMLLDGLEYRRIG